MNHHYRDSYHVAGEGVLTSDQNGNPIAIRPSAVTEVKEFRFSRLGPSGVELNAADRAAIETVAGIMTATPAAGDPDSDIPAGFTYLGQFVDHDLTRDRNADVLDGEISVEDLLQGRSPALDLDSLYGRGPERDPRFYAADGVSLALGSTTPIIPGKGIPGDDNPEALKPHDGFDLPRLHQGATPAEQRTANIPDGRNDENLAVAQTHLAFIKFHNRVVAALGSRTPSVRLFATARDLVVRHYQWMLRHDFLPRVVAPEIVDDVFTHGRRFFEVPMAYPAPGWYPRYGDRHIPAGDPPTMPIEFSVAAYRFGHSMVRDVYEWNQVFNSSGPKATLGLLFAFSGTSGILAPPTDVNSLNDPNAGTIALPSNWIVDFRRLYDFSATGRDDLKLSASESNLAKRIDTLLVDPLTLLPLGSFGGRGAAHPATGLQLNLAFRNLTRAGIVRLGSGQQLAEFLGVPALTEAQIRTGDGTAAVLDTIPDDQRRAFVARTPLWFYILREAELGGGRLTGVGGRIVAEVFHRAMEGSVSSIVRDPGWRPVLGGRPGVFDMADLLLFAHEDRKELLAPLG